MFGPRGLAPDASGPDGASLDNAQLAVNIVRWLTSRRPESGAWRGLAKAS